VAARVGFAAMSADKRRDIASKGGKTAHLKGTAHEWTADQAREAGRKGGTAAHRRSRETAAAPKHEHGVGGDAERERR